MEKGRGDVRVSIKISPSKWQIRNDILQFAWRKIQLRFSQHGTCEIIG
jgi:hypothetical protein